jgi:DNA-binding transcriptional ArsR family regulator
MLNYQDPIDGAFRALADPRRRQMLDRLAQGEASVSELAAPLSISLAAVLQQIQYLEACGVVHSRKAGRTRICSLNREALQHAEAWLSRRRALWESNFDRLGELLRQPPTEE